MGLAAHDQDWLAELAQRRYPIPLLAAPDWIAPVPFVVRRDCPRLGNDSHN
jgi:hypothetical protein